MTSKNLKKIKERLEIACFGPVVKQPILPPCCSLVTPIEQFLNHFMPDVGRLADLLTA